MNNEEEEKEIVFNGNFTENIQFFINYDENNEYMEEEEKTDHYALEYIRVPTSSSRQISYFNSRNSTPARRELNREGPRFQ